MSDCRDEGCQRWQTPAPDATWRDVPRGGVIPRGGNAAEYQTGDWRSARPIHDADLCIQCRLCWVYCPDSSILTNEEGEVIGIDYDHCKGCGICAAECPKEGAMTMIAEEF